MGVDIYGIKPKVASEKPQIPDNYEDMSSEEQSAFWDKYNAWEQENPGYYFRNNWWHWRPIQILIGYFNERNEIGIPENELNSLGYNDGVGVSDPAHCEQLAICFRQLAEDMRKNNQNNVNLNTGSWYYKKVLDNGEIVTDSVKNEVVLARLNESYPALFFDEAELDGVGYESSHSTNYQNLEDFATFLDNCNGFTIH